MSTPDKQKAKKRKNRRAAKSVANSATTSSTLISPAVTSSEQDLADIQRLMDAEDGDGVPNPPSFSRGPNPYLGGERCLLCRCERPDPPQMKQDIKSGEISDSQKDNAGVGTLSQLPLWVCPDCRKTVEEEEKKAAAYDSSFLEQDLRLEPPTLPFLPELAGDFSTSNSTVCTCEACTERRQIEAEHEKETQELQQCWMELRHVVRCIYREAGTGLASENQDGEASPQRDTDKIKELVHRLCTRDAHQLYQRLESQGREYVIEMKVRLLKQLTSGHKTPIQAKQFVSMLLEEYSNLCAAAKSLASFLGELETEHLKRFNLTWELHNKHLFQSIIYSDPFVQNSLPMLIAQLRSGAASKESYHEDTYPNILHRYLKFDDEMSVILVVWRDCQQLLETYNEEQAALRAKQKMLKEDWEFFKAQRRLLEQQVLKKTPTSSATHNFEAQFTETMRHILQGTKPAQEECQCPNCNKKRYGNHRLVPQGAACTGSTHSTCPCEECTLSHIIKCGIISSEGRADQLPPPHDISHGSGNTSNATTVTTTNCFSVESSPYMIDVTPPSMSSTNSSSGSSSPINVDPKRLVLPFDVCPESFELTEDEIPEEIEDDDESLSESDGGDVDDNEGDDEGGDGSFTATTEYQSAEEGLELTSMVDNEHENNDTSCGEGVAEYASMDSMTSGAPVLGLPTVTADAVKTDCGCTHCTKARFDQPKPAEEVINQCQCHACMVQSGKNVPTCLPHVPSAPRAAAFHLYPHIHGSNCLQTAVALHGHTPHVGPVLQSHLYEYEVHTPTSTTRQPKSLLNPQKKHNANFSLDLDSHEALHEHIYHAYGEWDNAYDSTKLMLSSHKYVGGGLGSELFSAPPPPLMNGSPFVNVGDHLSTEGAMSLASAMKTSVYQHNTVAMNSPLTSMATSTSFANTSVASSNGDHIHTEACFKSMKPGSHNNVSTSQPLSTVASRSVTSGCGTVPSTAASAAVATNNPVILTSSAAATSSTLSTAGGTSSHNDHCLKHNPFLHTHHASFTSTHATTTISASPPLSSHQLPVKLTSERIRSTAIKEESARSNTQGTALNMPHTCSHQHNPVINPQLATNGNQPFIPPNAGLSAGLPTLNNITVSLPTPGVCNDPDCDGHHDAEYDSIDDSCSEQSSSTSTSNQKDGKYCDCCYCEFFGHSNPPQAPTSRNYAEIRDRLRLRLKKKVKGEQKTEEPRQPPPPPPKEEVVDDRGLEELVRFINGEEKENKSASAKAAKRARQKQKKAEERAKREAEMKAALEQERMHQEHRRAIAKAMEDAAKQQHLLQQRENRKEETHKKKKSKIKENGKFNDENRNPCFGKDQNQKDTQVQAQISDSGCIASNAQTAGKYAPRPKSLSKRGEADGCQTPSSVTTSMKEASHDHTQAECRTSAHSPPSNHAARAGPKGEARPEKSRKGKHATPSLSSASSSATCLSQKAAVPSQSQHQSTRGTKTPPQNHQQPVPPPNNQHPRGRINHSNNKVNDFSSQKTGNVVLVGENSRNNRKTCENHSQVYQGNASSLQHQNNKQQQILNNNNNSKKVEKGNTVNGTQTPTSPPTPVQQRKNNNPGQTTKCLARTDTSSRQNAPGLPVPAEAFRSGRGDGLPSQLVNGNLVCTQETIQNKKSDTKILKVSHQVHSNTPKLKVEEKTSKPSDQQAGVTSGKTKKNKRKNKSAEDLDEIFMPRDLDPDNGEIDELDREIEEFKRFCLDSTPMPKQEKLQVNMNLKDIFNKKKSGVSCA